MDPVYVKKHFNKTMNFKNKLKEKMSSFEETAKKLKASPYITKNQLEIIKQTRCDYEDQLKEYEQMLVETYKAAIFHGIDVDNSRLLRVFQFFIRNALDITYFFRCINLPRGSTSIWGIVILTALIYLWATV